MGVTHNGGCHAAGTLFGPVFRCVNMKVWSAKRNRYRLRRCGLVPSVYHIVTSGPRVGKRSLVWVCLSIDNISFVEQYGDYTPGTVSRVSNPFYIPDDTDDITHLELTDVDKQMVDL